AMSARYYSLISRKFQAAKRAAPNKSCRTRLSVTSLEDRTAPAVFTVTSLGDSGTGTLRQCLLDAEMSPGADTITFDASVFSTPKLIALSSELAVTSDVTIQGPGSDMLTVSASATGRVFNISGPAPHVVSFSGLTATGGMVTGTGGAFTI